MWLRDELPAKLNHRARILLYGYNSQLQGPDAGQSILRDYCGQFWHDLMNIRDHPSVRASAPEAVMQGNKLIFSSVKTDR